MVLYTDDHRCLWLSVRLDKHQITNSKSQINSKFNPSGILRVDPERPKEVLSKVEGRSRMGQNSNYQNTID